MNNQQQIDDLQILGFSFTKQHLEDLRNSIMIAQSTFENSKVDPNKALQNRLHTIKDRIEYMIEQKRVYKY
jgi:hypothetical protein